jgi:anti-anti-sigma factor
MSSSSATDGKAASRLVWPLTVERSDHEGIAVFVVSGRLGTLSSGELIETLARAVAAGEHRIVVDLSGVDYLSSAGLLALHALLGRFVSAGGELALCGLTVPVRTSFDLSGLLSDFIEEPSRELAVARLSGGASAPAPLPSAPRAG